MDFWRAVEILNKRKWLIALSVVVSTVLTFGATRLLGSRWVAAVSFTSTAIHAYSQSSDPLFSDNPGGDRDKARAQVAVYQELVRREEILKPALVEIGAIQPGGAIRSAIDVENIMVEARGPRLFHLLVMDRNPELAKGLANALARQFQKANAAFYSQWAEDNVQSIERQLQDADRKLDEMRRQAENYRRQREIVTSLQDQLQPMVWRLQAARQKLDLVEEQLADGKARLAEREQQLATLPRTIPVERVAASSPLVRQLEEELAVAEKELLVLGTRLTDQAVEVRRATARRDALATRLQAELGRQSQPAGDQPNPQVAAVRRAIAELRQEIRGFEAQKVALGKTIQATQARVDSYLGVDTRLATLDADVAREAEARSNIVWRLQSARLALDAARNVNPINIIRFVGDLNPPLNTTEGRTRKLLVVAALCALVGTGSLLIAYDGVDRRLRTVPQAELALPAPVLAAIPQPMGAVTPQALARATELHPRSLHSEAYHFLGLHLLSAGRQEIRSVMVISAKADQGSTSTVTNLGITLAQAGRRVILVDANMRLPALHKVFELENDFGLTDLLMNPDSDSLERALHTTPQTNLHVVPSGSPTDNPWMMLRSQNLAEVARRLQDLADYVIFDTPSALAFTDALNLAPVVDAACLCVRALQPPSGAEQRLVEFLEQSDVTVLGSVLNDVPASVLDSYHNYQRYYPSGPADGPVAVAAERPVAVAADVSTWIDAAPLSSGVETNGNGSERPRNGRRPAS